LALRVKHVFGLNELCPTVRGVPPRTLPPPLTGRAGRRGLTDWYAMLVGSTEGVEEKFARVVGRGRRSAWGGGPPGTALRGEGGNVEEAEG